MQLIVFTLGKSNIFWYTIFGYYNTNAEPFARRTRMEVCDRMKKVTGLNAVEDLSSTGFQRNHNDLGRVITQIFQEEIVPPC